MSLIELIEGIVEIFGEYWLVFLKGTLVTIAFSLITVIGGAVFGTLITFFRLKKSWAKKIFDGYVEIFRGIPLLVQLFIVVLILPVIWPKYISISIALILNSTAYVSELVRAGIEAVDNGQYEAARSLGMSHRQAMRKIIMPQAIKNILPGIGNEFITVIKETSIASVFFIGDLMTAQNIISGSDYRVLEPYLIIAMIYFSLTFSLSKIIKYIEKRLI